MDTLAIRKNSFNIPCRIFEYGIIVSILLTFMLTNSPFYSVVRANDLLANTVISAPSLIKNSTETVKQLTPEYLKDKFEEEISRKYSGSVINDVEEGIKHVRMIKYFSGRPVRINIIEMNPQIAKDYEIKPATASTYNLNHRTTVRTIAGRTNSVVAINGGFFKPETGVPLGTLMIDKKLYTGPIYDRAALGIFENGYDVGRIKFRGSISSNNISVKIDNINQPRILSSYVLAYTRDWGSYAPASPRYGVQLQVVGNKVIKASANPLFIPENGYVIVGPKEKLSKLFGADHVDIDIGTNPQWHGVKHIISGGPYLVRNGEIFVDASEEKLTAIGGRNPRTAIGYNAGNNFIIVTADGREGSSIGLTLYELAYFMKSIGCINAINLDGGGSTVMYVKGRIVNHPPQPGGIALSNVLLISKSNQD